MKTKLFFVVVFTLGVFFRFYQLGQIPQSYTPDELAQGYTAYSLLTTGRDEWGSSNFISLRSFGDFKLPFQTWLMIPSIKLDGLNPFSVRLPNAIFSIISLFSVYFLVKKIFPDRPSVASIAFTLFAFSPWSISLSRLALEANLIVSLLIVGLTFFYYQRYFLSALFFASCFYTYHSAKVFLPLFILTLIFFHFRRSLIQFLIPLLVLLLPLFVFNPAQNSRSTDIAIFHPTDNWSAVADARFTLTQNGLPDILARFLQNKATYTIIQFCQNYFSYFSPQFLVTQGAGETTYGMLPGFGAIGFVVLFGLLLTLWQLIKNKRQINSHLIILFAGLIIAPLPAALAKGYLAGNRASLMLPFIIILSAYGLTSLSRYGRWLVFSLFALETVFFVTTYFFSANQVLAHGLLYGHQQANQYIHDLQPAQVIYSRKLSEPQAYYLFFQQTPPISAQNQTRQWLEYDQKHLSFLDQLGEYRLNNVIFKEISLPSDLSTSHTLLIGRPEEFHDLKPTSVIYYPYYTSQTPAIYLYLTP